MVWFGEKASGSHFWGMQFPTVTSQTYPAGQLLLLVHGGGGGPQVLEAGLHTSPAGQLASL
jgi:hypothetical protein